MIIERGFCGVPLEDEQKNRTPNNHGTSAKLLFRH